MKDKPTPSLTQIGLAATRWYNLKQEAQKLKTERGDFRCNCGETSCYLGWKYYDMPKDEMLECGVAERFYEKTKPYHKKVFQAKGAKNRLNALIKKYNL